MSHRLLHGTLLVGGGSRGADPGEWRWGGREFDFVPAATWTETKEEVELVRTKIRAEMARRNLPLSEDSPAALERLLLGHNVGHECKSDPSRTATLAAPERYGQQFLAMASRGVVTFELFERMTGIGAWLFSVR